MDARRYAEMGLVSSVNRYEYLLNSEDDDNEEVAIDETT